VIGFRTSFSQRIGYDAALNGAEDIDFMLRAIVAKARIHLSPVPGYRQYAYPDSLSRRIDNQRKMYAIALAKHDYADVARLYEQASFSKHVTIWGLISMAIFRSDYDSVLQFLSECALLIDAPEEILEPAVCAKPEGWRLRFHRGTTLLQMGKTKESLDDLYAIEADIPTAEGANNLGVALAKAGALTEATRLFQLAITRQPSYFDAEQNLKNIGEYRITSHLIRSTPFRYEYLPMPESGSSI
jgi:tetratricopeptide (TPR) repeat protein